MASAGERAVASGLAAVLGMVAPAPVAAQAPEAHRVDVRPLEVEGELPAHQRAQLEEAIGQGVARSGLEIVDDPGADTVTATVRVQGGDQHLAMQLAGADGVARAKVEQTCDLCGAAELAELAADLAAALGRKVGAQDGQPPRLDVQSRPAGARVLVDGVAVGTTPLQVDVEPGEHTVAVEREGHSTRTHELSFAPGELESLSVTLEPDRGVLPWLAAVGWTGLAVGAASAAGGVTLLAIDGRPITTDCTGDNRDDDGDCKFVHETLGGGVALIAVGAVLIAGGITAIVLSRPRGEARRRARVHPAGLGIRF
jgi:hypothetical protein